jgi:hypothetical protein
LAGFNHKGGGDAQPGLPRDRFQRQAAQFLPGAPALAEFAAAMPIQLPPYYLERHPTRGPWLDPSAPPEEDAWDIEILHADGTKESAVIAFGRFWHFGFHEPIGWRRVLLRGLTSVQMT